jgi:hypothetical protein
MHRRPNQMYQKKPLKNRNNEIIYYPIFIQFHMNFKVLTS